MCHILTQRAYCGLAYIKIVFRALMRSSWLAARCRDFTAFLRFTATEPLITVRMWLWRWLAGVPGEEGAIGATHQMAPRTRLDHEVEGAYG